MKIDRILNLSVWVVAAALYYPAFSLCYRTRWDSIDYTHAFFILPVSLFLVWSKRDELRGTRDEGRRTRDEGRGTRDEVRSTKSSLVLLVVGLLLFIFGYRLDYLFIMMGSLLLVAAGLVGYLYGSKVLKALWFPLAYLAFLVPPPAGILDNITVPMRYGVSVVTDVILKTAGYPIVRQGLLLSIGGHEVYLGEACSGFRSLITLLALGTVYVYLSKNDTSKKWLLAASIVPLALLGNLVRVISVVLVTFYIGENQAQQFYHDASGFLVFLILIFGLLGFEKVLNRKNV